MKGRLRAAVLALPLILALPLHAQDTAAEDLDETQRMYRQALQSIAEGRKQDARVVLEQVINREALHAGAWLDLALIQCGLGNKVDAERMFNHIERNFAPPPAIVELINEARASRCNDWQALSQLTVSAGRGSSSNVNQGTRASGADIGLPIDLPVADEFKPMHDQYISTGLDYWRELDANGTIGTVQLQSRRHDRLRDYDSASLFIGIDHPWRSGNWNWRISGQAGMISLGNQLYQQQAQVQLRVEPPIILPTGLRLGFSTALTRADYRTLSNFDSTTGELRTQLSYRDTHQYASISAGYLFDHALGERPGGNRRGWLLNASWRRQLIGNSIGELGYSHQRWDGSKTYSPGFLDIIRDQVTQVWRGSLTYPLTTSQSLVLDARLVRNKENIALFQYNERQLQLSWQWQN